MNKKIANVVFYKFWGENGEMQQACIFYEDGTAKNVSEEEGKEAVAEIAKEEKINTKGELEKLINTKRIYTLSGEEFEREFKKFLGKGTALVPVSNVKPAISLQPSKKKTYVKPEIKSLDEQKNEEENVYSNSDKSIPTPIIDSAKSNVIEPVKITSYDVDKEDETKEEKKKPGLFKRTWFKIVAILTAAAIIFTGGFHLSKRLKKGDIFKNNISNTQKYEETETQDKAYLELLEKSTNKDQKDAMKHQSESLDAFNRDFANAHIEEGKKIKAALTWNEMMALNLAYNTYTKEQIKIMFNGSEVNSVEMSNAYKNATLQLMGAYVISTRENPVNSAAFLTNEKERKFVEKYNDLFLTMKETTGKEQVKAIDAFYAELNKDFPITEKVREEGISHADSRKQLESYKAAVAPMVAAAEIMFQNTNGIDHTMSDKAIKYFNDLGLCNIVIDNFERAEAITLAAETDETQPTYAEFKKAKEIELNIENNYLITDENRDLSQLDEFKKWVNNHKHDNKNNTNVSSNISSKKETSTKNETSTKTETSTLITDNRQEAVESVGEEAVKDAEDKVKEEIDKQNTAAKEEAEKEAAEKTEQTKQEVQESIKDLLDKIQDANDKINNGGTVNENDFGDHNVDFFPEFEDGNGNLNDTVTDITPDGTGSKTEEDLPDPNQTGAIFDGNVTTEQTTNSTPSYDSFEQSTNNQTTNESNEVIGSTGVQDIYEYEEVYVPATFARTNEEIVDAYIASLENESTTEPAKVYTK